MLLVSELEYCKVSLHLHTIFPIWIETNENRSLLSPQTLWGKWTTFYIPNTELSSHGYAWT